MKYFFACVLCLFLLSCSDNEMIESTPFFEYLADNGESFSTNNPVMNYDTAQFATFIKYDDPSLRVRCNFRGRTTGTYIEDEAIFYKFTYDSNGASTVEIVCDTYTGIEVNVFEYGNIGEDIAGEFSATACDGNPSISEITGSFRVVRTE